MRKYLSIVKLNQLKPHYLKSNITREEIERNPSTGTNYFVYY